MNDATPKPQVEIWDARIWRGKGTRIPGLKPLGAIYGTGRDWDVSTRPSATQLVQFESAVTDGLSGNVSGCWLNFEFADDYLRVWTASDWESWSYHLWAEFLLVYGPYGFGGALLYAATPHLNDWHTKQWEATASLRIPNLASQDIYTGPHQTRRFESLMKSRKAGLDIAVFIGMEDQSVSPAKECTMREFVLQVRLVEQLCNIVPDNDGPAGKVIIVYWDGPDDGKSRRSSDETWAEGHDNVLRYFDLIPWGVPNPNDPPVVLPDDGDAKEQADAPDSL